MVKHKIFNGTGKVHRFFVPFKVSESAKTDLTCKSKRINGVAISETTTLNGHVFLAEELEPSAPTLCDKPLLKDHNNSVDCIVGRTTNNCSYDPISKCIMFEADVMDDDMCEKIEKGLVNSVSVGAMIKNAEYKESQDGNGTYIMRGIKFVELSLVAVPADQNAGFSCVMNESFTEVEETNDEEQKLMSDIKEQLAELATQKEKLSLELEQLAVEKLTLAREKAIAENVALKAKPSQEVKETTTKGQVVEETKKEEIKLPFKIVSEDVVGSYGLEFDYTKFNSKVLMPRGN